jgi:ABC-type phosphate transport system substrate-binding protein
VLAVYEPYPLDPDARVSSLTLTTSATAPVGTYSLTVTGSGSGAVSGTTTRSLTIAAATSPLQPKIQVWADDYEGLLYTVVGDRTPWILTVARGGGFTGNVSFSVEGLPLGATASFDPPTLEPGYTKTLVWLSATTLGLQSNITIRARGEGAPDAIAYFRFASAPPWT